MVAPDVQVYEFCKKMQDVKSNGQFKNVNIVLNFFSAYYARISPDTPAYLKEQAEELIEFIKFSGSDFSSLNSLGYRQVFLYLNNMERFLAYRFQSLKEFGASIKEKAMLRDLDRADGRSVSHIMAVNSGTQGLMSVEVAQEYYDAESNMMNKSNWDRDERWLQMNTPRSGQTGYEYGVDRGYVRPWNGPIEEYRRAKNVREISNENDVGLVEEDMYKDMRFARPGFMSTERNHPTLTSRHNRWRRSYL